MTTVTTNVQSRRRTPSAPSARRLTKKDQLIRMLRGAAGADVGTYSAKLGWQTHTTRAGLTGLRRAGCEVVAEKSGQGKPARYRIVGTPDVTVSAEAAATEAPETTDAR